MQSYQQSYFRIQRCLRIKSSSTLYIISSHLSVWVSMCCAMIGQLNGLYFIIQPAKFRSCFDLSGLKSSPLYLNPHIITIHILLPSFSYFVLHVTEPCCFSSDLRPTCSIEHGPFIQVEKTWCVSLQHRLSTLDY